MRVEQVKPVFLDDVESTRRIENNGPNSNIPCDDGVTSDDWERRDTVRWRVTSVEIESGKRTSEEYDAVLICNGLVLYVYTWFACFIGSIIYQDAQNRMHECM